MYPATLSLLGCPTEIILWISSYLFPFDLLHFALTCKTISLILTPHSSSLKRIEFDPRLLSGLWNYLSVTPSRASLVTHLELDTTGFIFDVDKFPVFPVVTHIATTEGNASLDILPQNPLLCVLPALSNLRSLSWTSGHDPCGPHGSWFEVDFWAALPCSLKALRVIEMYNDSEEQLHETRKVHIRVCKSSSYLF